MRNLQGICRPVSWGNSRVLMIVRRRSVPNYIGHPQPGCKERKTFGLPPGRLQDDSVAAIQCYG